MTGSPTTVTALATYRNKTPYPFCPGCGHGPILDHLNEALRRLQVDPRETVIVSDIGCSGLSDQYFVTSAFHGLHGRSITYASGIKLARPDLTVIVIMGDGGTGIGGAHLLSAARRNLGITVLVFNNFNFGMTGGQHSSTTPVGAFTSTTPSGNLERPLDICATVAANGAGFVYRGTSFDKDLADRIAEGINHLGMSVLDIWEPCTAYYAPTNRLTRKALYEMFGTLHFGTGVLQKRDTPEYAAAYRHAHIDALGKPNLVPAGIPHRFPSTLDRRYSLVVAGSAGGKIGTATRLVARAAVLSGLWTTQRNDYPVTVQSGHSVSELIVSPEEINYTGVVRPDALVILSSEGQLKAQRYLALMEDRDRVFVLPSFTEVQTKAMVTVIDPTDSPVRLSKANVALATLGAVVKALRLLPVEALEEAVRQRGGERWEEELRTVRAGVTLRQR